MTEKIMGQDVNSLLTIKDNSQMGKIEFFTVICIILSVFVLYNIAFIIWSIKKEQKLLELKSLLYRTFKKKQDKKLHAPKIDPVKDEEINKIRTIPKDKDIDKALESIHTFHIKKHL